MKAAYHLHGVGADGLRDATRLARSNLGFPDEVQQRRLRRQASSEALSASAAVSGFNGCSN
jgi:hypothetical protein